MGISNVENVSQVTVRVQVFPNSIDLIQYNLYTGVYNKIVCQYLGIVKLYYVSSQNT